MLSGQYGVILRTWAQTKLQKETFTNRFSTFYPQKKEKNDLFKASKWEGFWMRCTVHRVHGMIMLFVLLFFLCPIAGQKSRWGCSCTSFTTKWLFVLARSNPIGTLFNNKVALNLSHTPPNYIVGFSFVLFCFVLISLFYFILVQILLPRVRCVNLNIFRGRLVRRSVL